MKMFGKKYVPSANIILYLYHENKIIRFGKVFTVSLCIALKKHYGWNITQVITHISYYSSVFNKVLSYNKN